jgi:glycosyltransferase involved in cell wall biosynthesis
VTESVRVLHILPSVRGYGAERLIVELLKYLPSHQIEAALLTIYEPAPDAREALPFTVLDAARKTRQDRFFVWRLIRQIRRYRPDIVHTHTHVGKYWGRLAALVAGTRYIVHTEHNPCDFRRTRMERIWDWLLHRMTARVITFFKEQGTRLSEFEHLPMRKVVVIPNGLASNGATNDRKAARDRLGVTRNEFAIMLIGRMEYQKNHILALRAFAALQPETRAKSVLLFAGAGENEVTLRGLAHALGIDERVRFLGYRTDVPALLPGADLVLMTSWFEGMPLALMEAMLADVPIVSTPWVGARNMLSDGRFGFLAAGYEPAQVAEQIERAIARPQMRRDVAQRALRHARESYDIDHMVDAHRKMYLQLCGAPA